jgi:hypothetical protein
MIVIVRDSKWYFQYAIFTVRNITWYWQYVIFTVRDSKWYFQYATGDLYSKQYLQYVTLRDIDSSKW